MRYVVSAMLVIVGVIHVIPVLGVIGSARLTALYGLDFSDPSLSILMRHRAVLFGLLGFFLIFAAFKPTFQFGALVAGFVSVVSFLLIAWSSSGYNAEVARVVQMDLVALVCLLVAAAIKVRLDRGPAPNI